MPGAGRASAFLHALADGTGADGDSARRRRSATVLRTPRRPAKCCRAPGQLRSYQLRSYLNLHSVASHFPSGSEDLGVGWARFIQNRIGVVDVEENLAFTPDATERRERAVRARDWKVPHLEGFLPTATHSAQFVVGPERAVKE